MKNIIVILLAFSMTFLIGCKDDPAAPAADDNGTAAVIKPSPLMAEIIVMREARAAKQKEIESLNKEINKIDSDLTEAGETIASNETTETETAK